MRIHDRNFRKRVGRRMAETGETWEDSVREVQLAMIHAGPDPNTIESPPRRRRAWTWDEWTNWDEVERRHGPPDPLMRIIEYECHPGWQREDEHRTALVVCEPPMVPIDAKVRLRIHIPDKLFGIGIGSRCRDCQIIVTSIHSTGGELLDRSEHGADLAGELLDRSEHGIYGADLAHFRTSAGVRKMDFGPGFLTFEMIRYLPGPENHDRFVIALLAEEAEAT